MKNTTHLYRFVDHLLAWNRRINLTAARTADGVREHVEDSLAVVPHIPADAVRLLDVGSGGGFPGLVVAIVRPALSVTLLEPVHKKRAFLASAARELGLGNVDARAERLEDHSGRDYDVAVSRATWAVPDWLERAEPFVRPGGVILAMEGREQHALPAGAVRHPYALGDRTRAVIVLPK
jgi:16S rRNA (guanine527-N7)-methyltransferase